MVTGQPELAVDGLEQDEIQGSFLHMAHDPGQIRLQQRDGESIQELVHPQHHQRRRPAPAP